MAFTPFRRKEESTEAEGMRWEAGERGGYLKYLLRGKELGVIQA